MKLELLDAKTASEAPPLVCFDLTSKHRTCFNTSPQHEVSPLEITDAFRRPLISHCHICDHDEAVTDPARQRREEARPVRPYPTLLPKALFHALKRPPRHPTVLQPFADTASLQVSRPLGCPRYILPPSEPASEMSIPRANFIPQAPHHKRALSTTDCLRTDNLPSPAPSNQPSSTPFDEQGIRSCSGVFHC